MLQFDIVQAVARNFGHSFPRLITFNNNWLLLKVKVASL